jgi:hypothetical protein
LFNTTELAGQYLVAGNAVAAFYVAQTILFLNSIHQSPTLLLALCRKKSEAVLATFGTAVVYSIAIGACGYFEHQLRFIDDTPPKIQSVVLKVCMQATYGRVTLVLLLACGCALAIRKLKPEVICTQPANQKFASDVAVD